MTAREMAPAIGSRVAIASGIGDVLIDCRVIDVKTSWNQVRLLVEPISGSGSAWVELSRLRRSPAEAANDVYWNTPARR